jgi:L,D-transpeptidase catalytic domain
MKFTRRQLVEGGLVAGFLGLAAKPVFASVLDDQVATLNVRRRPDFASAQSAAQPRLASSPFRQPHPGQPLPADARPLPMQAQPQLAELRPASVPARPRVVVERTVNPQLVAAARASFDRHRNELTHSDVVGIVDFSKMSRDARFYLLDTNSGRVTEHYVAHGRGSDPGHTGFVQSFSNRPGSMATSEGGYVTAEYYPGKYGRSMRVRGLDWTNNNAYSRAIVVHSAWYAEPSMLATHGLLGRSEGCFATSYNSLQETMDRLGPGHFLYAART